LTTHHLNVIVFYFAGVLCVAVGCRLFFCFVFSKEKKRRNEKRGEVRERRRKETRERARKRRARRLLKIRLQKKRHITCNFVVVFFFCVYFEFFAQVDDVQSQCPPHQSHTCSCAHSPATSPPQTCASLEIDLLAGELSRSSQPPVTTYIQSHAQCDTQTPNLPMKKKTTTTTNPKQNQNKKKHEQKQRDGEKEKVRGGLKEKKKERESEREREREEREERIDTHTPHTHTHTNTYTHIHTHTHTLLRADLLRKRASFSIMNTNAYLCV